MHIRKENILFPPILDQANPELPLIRLAGQAGACEEKLRGAPREVHIRPCALPGLRRVVAKLRLPL